MQTEDLIPASEFCMHSDVEISFIQSLQQSGLIQIIEIGESGYLQSDQLKELEKWIRLHRDLEINLEGIEAVSHLLERVKNLQNELSLLKKRLSLYENPT
jgi:chaperone modulatory protein CbpM